MEAREDVLCYATPALEKLVEVTGPIELVLYISSSARDTDFTGKLVNVYLMTALILASLILGVQVFDSERTLQIQVAFYELPPILEQLRQEALVPVFQQPVTRGQVLVVRDIIQLTFLAAGIWAGDAYQGTIVVGPAISRVFHPHVLKDMSPSNPLPLTTQKQLQDSYNALPLVDEGKQQALGFLLNNLFVPGMLPPQFVEVAQPLPESTPRRFTVMMEQNRELIEKRYAGENRLFLQGLSQAGRDHSA